MIFTVSTKPLIDALNLGIVNANVSKFNSKSCIAQISANKNSLLINVEPNLVVTEIRLKGMGDSDTEAISFVDSLTLKQLVSTFEANTTKLEFVEGGLILHCGKSKYTLPNQAPTNAVRLNRPTMSDYDTPMMDIKKVDWNFIKNRQQQYASMAFNNPVYILYYFNASGDVIIGDFDNNVFSHSRKGTLNETCLLTDSILNLICSVPEGAKMKKIENGHQIQVKTDAFELISDFYPRHEDDEGVGSYNSDLIMETMSKPEKYIKVPTAELSKLLKRADLLSTSGEATVFFGVQDGYLFMTDSNVDGRIEVEGHKDLQFKGEFKLKLLAQTLNNYPGDVVYIGPKLGEDGEGNIECVGILTWDDDIEVVLAAVE